MIKLRKLPEMTPVKLTIALAPSLHAQLQTYAERYQEVYGASEPLARIVPHMLQTFLESDVAFNRWRKARAQEFGADDTQS